ncbi:lysophospholipase L1-like esterase [Actinoplanes octamycinicus]|uniref:Lysophospholipase L1-like esterase n=1 Tax=Actinoplanes octamycinicus TaxID=135948 RepID=A0A7W7M763_9ACTN|nr:GDSL-type esterase/lipase family protein [Actinoplanes octamycinicus]MBB4739562.1 lysophospholipase L1-like esterase [Actinoplanes octamycinicus]GIE54743.1 lipoprotein [Actinoplanes octamycinicus]
MGVLGVFALACEGGAGAAGDPQPTKARTKAPTSAAAGYPGSMAALGDSITAGVGSCLAYLACAKNSWAVGDGNGIKSHYKGILAKNAKIEGHVHNFAEPGAEADALAGQAARAVAAKVQYVTVLIGANDACAGRVGDMTPVATFRDQVDRGLAKLKKGLPKARVLVASVPDLYRLWQVGRDEDAAVRVWRSGGICPSMLADPTSTASADNRRRRAVRDRIDAYDEQLRAACEAYGSRCRWDDGRVHDLRFTIDLVSPLDYFHPSLEGQNELAAVTFPERFDW